MKIYTKMGDQGETSLFGGKRVSKTDHRIEAYGTIDELNSIFGIILTEETEKKTEEILNQIQQKLFILGSELAAPESVKSDIIEKISNKDIVLLEEFIDEVDAKLKPLQNFILPGGKRSAAFLQFARTVCRRAERRIVELSSNENINSNIISYINRLSDLLFVLSRFENLSSDVPEILWNPRG